jgi:hypothetical protein
MIQQFYPPANFGDTSVFGASNYRTQIPLHTRSDDVFGRVDPFQRQAFGLLQLTASTRRCAASASASVVRSSPRMSRTLVAVAAILVLAAASGFAQSTPPAAALPQATTARLDSWKPLIERENPDRHSKYLFLAAIAQ